MKTNSGLFAHMVLQRSRNNASGARIAGTASCAGPVCATVRDHNGKIVSGFRNVRIGSARRGQFQGRLIGLPTGGPYDVELAVGDESLSVDDVLVGDVWLMGGQSNMQGCGHFSSESTLPDDSLVRAFYMDDVWRVAKDPLHNLWDCVDQVHFDLFFGRRPQKPAAYAGVGPGAAFGQEMRRLTKNVPQGLIACAHGGTGMAQWDPALNKLGSKSLYGAMLRRVQKNGGKVAGMIWYQGCNDVTEQDAPLYTQRMRGFLSALRRDCKFPALPVAMVQLARWIDASAQMGRLWNSVQEQQRLLPMLVSNLICVPAIDLPLEDCIHLSGRGQNVLGRRLAQAMGALTSHRSSASAPISIGKIWTERHRGTIAVHVEFENVVGDLKSGGRANGFQVVSPDGAKHVFDIALQGRRTILRTNIADAIVMGDCVLHYGYGTNPCCNIVDQAERSLPAFGPIRLGAERAISPFARTLQVSKILPSAGKLEALSYADLAAADDMRSRTFAGDFCDMSKEIMAQGESDGLLVFACGFRCSEKMSLNLILGYDGPLKAWLDGKQIFYDPDGTNPALACKAQIGFPARAGRHELRFALGTNHGAAWGLCLRLERIKLNRAQMASVGSVVLPEFAV